MVNLQLFESGWAAVIVACQTKFGESPSDARIEVLSRLPILERDVFWCEKRHFWRFLILRYAICSVLTNGRKGPLWRIATNVLINQSCSCNSGWSPTLAVRPGVANAITLNNWGHVTRVLEIGRGPLFGRPIAVMFLSFFENDFLHHLISCQFSEKRLNHERTYFFFPSRLLP